MKIKAAIIGMGVGQKHFDAIENYKGSKVEIICEKNKKKLSQLKKSFPNKIINLHPALLPNFGGKGMYGKFVHAAVLNAKKKESGITIHTVNENYDEGNYIAQFYTLVLEDETVYSLEEKIRELEHRYFSCVVDGYINSIIK